MILRKPAIASHAVPVGAARRVVAEAQLRTPEPLPALPPAPSAAERAAELQAETERARRQGYEQGLAQGSEEVKRVLARRSAELDALAASIERARLAALEGMEDLALGIAWEALCKLLGEAAPGREALLALVRENIGRVKDQAMVVRVNPADLATLQEHLPATAFAADASIELGGCIIEAGGGWIDATLETQLTRLRQTLLAARAARREPA
jgi:flagellar assembly protein FliH